MKTVKEVSELTGVSVRALHHYDAIGLLRPTRVTEAGYRLYDGEALKRLWTILLFRELDFPLAAIRAILDNPATDRENVLNAQIPAGRRDPSGEKRQGQGRGSHELSGI